MDKNRSIFEDSLAEFLKPIKELLEDPKITEVMINGAFEIFYEVSGKIIKSDCQFESEAALLAAARNISQFVGKAVTENEPIVDARLPDGSRICIVIAPCAKNGTTIAIRKFSKEKLTLKDLIQFNAMTAEMARFLDVATVLKRNILVSGGTGSGKTTLLNVLGSRIPGNERTIIIEDTAELQIKSNHVVRFETKGKDFEGKHEVTIRDLMKASLRLRPDRVIVGEVRGAEALDLIQAMNTGHEGSMGTVHANNPFQAMNRLETLCMLGDLGVPAQVIRNQIAEAVQLVVQANRLRDGSRKITAVTEILGHDGNKYITRDLFLFKQTGWSADGKLIGHHEICGPEPSFKDMIMSSGLNFPMGMFHKKAA